MKYSFCLIVAATVAAKTAGRSELYTRIPRTYSSSLKSLNGKNRDTKSKKQTTTITSFVANIPRCGGNYSSWQDDYQDDRRGDYNDYGSSSSQPNDQYYDDYYKDNNDGYYGRDGYDDRGGYYNDDDDRSPSSSNSRRGFSSSPLSSIPVPNIVKNGDRKIGVALLGLGALFTVLGMSLFFNKTLMRLGNLMFIGGIPMTIGPGRTAGYFFQPKKARATGCLSLGIFLVFIGWPVIGILLEIFGVVNLFGNMFPVALAILKTMPIIGPILKKAPGGGGGGYGRRGRNNDRYDDRSDYNDYDDRDDNYPEDYY